MFNTLPRHYLIILLFTTLGFYVPAHAESALTITYGADYKPFAWGEYGVAFGVQRDFVEEILVKRMGLKVEHEPCPWKRCQGLVKQNKRDGFFTVPTEERAEYTIASALPFYQTHFVMHTGKDNPNLALLRQVKELSDLEKMPDISHIHMLGSGWHEEALKNMRLVQVNVDAEKIPLLLAYQRADLYIEQAEMFRYQANQLGVLNQIVTIEQPSIRKLGWHLFISKRSPFAELMPEINKTLSKLKDSGELEKIKLALFKKHGIK